MQLERPSIVKRIVSMFLDHVLICFILLVPLFLFVGEQRPDANGKVLAPGFQFLFLGLMLVYFLKDCFGGRSLAKRIIKLQVVDNRTYQTATPVQCFVRNLTIVIWPLEVLITLFSPQRRLGDFIDRTKVINYTGAPVPTFEFE